MVLKVKGFCHVQNNKIQSCYLTLNVEKLIVKVHKQLSTYIDLSSALCARQ